jgi:RNA polymerase sigma factor FliA
MTKACPQHGILEFDVAGDRCPFCAAELEIFADQVEAILGFRRQGSGCGVAEDKSPGSSCNFSLIMPCDRELWDAWLNGRSIASRNALIERYGRLLREASELMAAKLPRVSAQELQSYGVFGLIDAIEKFQPSRGVKFETYAPRRIRGAILDGLRGEDWVPRLVRIRRQEPRRMLSIGADEQAGHLELLADDRASRDLERVDAADFFARACRGLNEAEQFIVRMYFEAGLTMRQIGDALELSESRVSQKLTDVLKHLRHSGRFGAAA